MFEITNDPVINLVAGMAAIAVLIYAANKLVERILNLSRHFGVSELFLGLTVLSIGTSIAEIITTVVGSREILRGSLDYKIGSGAILGTNIGSDLVQITLVTGIVAIFGAVAVRRRDVISTLPMMIAADIVVFVFALDGELSRAEGALLFFGYVVYLFALYRAEGKEKKLVVNGNIKLLVEAPMILLYFLVLYIAAEYILGASVYFVGYYGVGGSLIGVLVIGVATALPELTTALAGLIKKSPAMSLGTLIGSNITDPMMVLGLGSMISTLAVPKPTIMFDLPVLITAGTLAFIFFIKDKTLTKGKAVFMMVFYVVFVVMRLVFFAVD